jgi:hypothetical protein
VPVAVSLPPGPSNWLKLRAGADVGSSGKAIAGRIIAVSGIVPGCLQCCAA